MDTGATTAQGAYFGPHTPADHTYMGVADIMERQAARGIDQSRRIAELLVHKVAAERQLRMMAVYIDAQLGIVQQATRIGQYSLAAGAGEGTLNALRHMLETLASTAYLDFELEETE